MSENHQDGWRQSVIDKQDDEVPKQRSETYYYADGLGGSPQMWVKHNPGTSIPVRVEKVWPNGMLEKDDYDSSLQMNIASEVQAYRLYRALEAYFNDVRSPPWFLADYMEEDDV